MSKCWSVWNWSSERRKEKKTPHNVDYVVNITKELPHNVDYVVNAFS